MDAWVQQQHRLEVSLRNVERAGWQQEMATARKHDLGNSKEAISAAEPSAEVLDDGGWRDEDVVTVEAMSPRRVKDVKWTP